MSRAGNLLTLGFFLGITLANAGLYAWHRRRHPRPAEPAKTFPLSLPTRLFRWGRLVIVLGILVHLPLEALVLRPQGLTGWAFAGGAALALAGLALVACGLRALGPSFSPCYEGRVPPERARAGPYRLVAHPLYLGNMLCVGGLLVATFSALIAGLAALLLFFYFFAIRDENRMLEATP